MRFTSIKKIAIAILLFFPLAAWSQGPISIDTNIKGSRWPAFGVDSGAANAYVVTTVAVLAPSLKTGSQIMFFAAHANTSASTLVVDGSSAIPIKKNVSSALVAGDIPLNGLVIVLYDGTNFQIGGFQQISCSQLPALAGDVTSSAGSCTTTLANIPDGATMAGKVVASAISAPGTPAAGKDNLYVESTDKRLHDKNDAGVIGTTAVAKTAATHKAFTAMSTAGVFTDTQFDFSDLTGSATCAELPALIGDVTSSAGSCTTALANIPDGATMAGKVVATAISAPGTPASGKDNVYVDSTDKRLHDKNDAGVIGTTAVAKTAATHKTFTAMSAAGVFTDSQLDFSDLTGTPSACATCVTSATSLAVHTPMVGTGSQGSATISSAGQPGQVYQSAGSSTDPGWFDFSDWKIVPAANCNNASGGNGWSLPASNAPTLECRAGTNNLGGDLLWTNNNTSTNAQFTFQIPVDWVSSAQPYINIVYGSGANTSGTVKWTFSTACTKTDGSVTDDPSFNAESTTSGKTMAAASRMWAESVQFTAITSGNNCVAGSPVIVKVTSGNGSATGGVKVYYVAISGARRPVNQAN